MHTRFVGGRLSLGHKRGDLIGRSLNGTLKGRVVGWDSRGTAKAQTRVVRWHCFAERSVIDCDKVTYTNDDRKFSRQLDIGVYDVFTSRNDSVSVAKEIQIIAAKDAIFSAKLKVIRFVKFIE